MPDWKAPATLERLIAAIIASNNNKVDNQAIARYMDETYDAVENRTRFYKKEAQKLVKEAEAAGRMEMDMRKRAKDGGSSPRKSRGTPKKNASAGDLHGVVSGRVSKTPTKKKSSPVKQEYNSSDSSAFGEMPVTGNSFDFAAMNFNSGSSFDAGLVDGWDSGIV